MQVMLSAAPILAVIVGLVMGLKSLHAALLGASLALAIGVASFALSADLALQALVTWSPLLIEVLLIVGGGLLLSDVLRTSGAQQALAEWVTNRTGSGVGAVLLVVHGVTPFAESLTGFGIGITIGIPLLAHCGFSPRKVAAIGLLGLCAVPWGSMGPGTLVAATMAGLGFDALGLASAGFSAIPMALIGLAAAWLGTGADEARGTALLKGVASGLLLAASIGLANALVGTSAAGALGALAMTCFWLWRGGRTDAPRSALSGLALRALQSYGLLLMGVLVSGWAVRHWQLPAPWQGLASPALWLFVAAAYFSKGWPASGAIQRVSRSWWQVAPVTALLIILGVVMAVSGMAGQLAHGLAKGGDVYVFFAPFLGALGGFITGSNTGANAMFAAPQAEIAQVLGVAVLPFMAIHNVSAALLLMASPGKVEMACQLAAVSSDSQRKWVQMAVLGIDLLGVLLLAMLGMGVAQWGRAPG